VTAEAASRARNEQRLCALRSESRGGSKTVKRNRSKTTLALEKNSAHDYAGTPQLTERLSDDQAIDDASAAHGGGSPVLARIEATGMQQHLPFTSIEQSTLSPWAHRLTAWSHGARSAWVAQSRCPPSVRIVRRHLPWTAAHAVRARSAGRAAAGGDR
jgi:hypothetical protein